jgi:hypothetical protein
MSVADKAVDKRAQLTAAGIGRNGCEILKIPPRQQ